MTTSDRALTPAPAAVIRIAQWPIEALDQLAAPDLAAKAAAASDATNAAAREDFVAAYALQLERQRAQLWRTTGADPEFRRAAALSSPSLMHALARYTPTGRRNKRARHMETSLYRYLARAVARLEPGGLWTGVTLATFGNHADTRVQREPARANIAPDLAPFRDLVRALARQDAYVQRGPYRLNPTLQPNGRGGWHYAQRSSRGALAWKTLPPQIAWADVHAALAGKPVATRRGLCTALASWPPAVADGLVSLAIENGIVLGGLRFPVRFTSPWDALRLVAQSLLPEHRKVWSTAVATIESHCDRLEALLSDAQSQTIEQTVEQVTQAIVTLAQSLGVSLPTLPSVVLRCDLTSGFRIQLGRTDADRLAGILARWVRLESTHDTGQRWRTQAAQALAACGDTRVTAYPAQAVADRRARPTHADGHPQDGPPLGALVLRPRRDGLRRPWVRGLSDVPTATHARHAYHLAKIGDPLLPWFRETYRDLARGCGVTIADLAHDHGGSPNVLARPSYTDAVVDPWGADPCAIPLDTLQLRDGPRSGSALLYGSEGAVATHAFTATQCDASDVVLRRLMTTSFDGRAASASSEPKPTIARPVNEDSMLLEPESWVLSPQAVRALTSARGAPRYLHWQEFARTRRWPPRVRITVGQSPSIAIATDSPLALEAVFEGVRADATITVEAMPDDGWIRSDKGHHLAELVLPVRRTTHFWTPHPTSLSDATFSTRPVPAPRHRAHPGAAIVAADQH